MNFEQSPVTKKEKPEESEEKKAGTEIWSKEWIEDQLNQAKDELLKTIDSGKGNIVSCAEALRGWENQKRIFDARSAYEESLKSSKTQDDVEKNKKMMSILDEAETVAREIRVAEIGLREGRRSRNKEALKINEENWQKWVEKIPKEARDYIRV